MLFTFPSRYSFTIGHRGVLRLGGWSPHVQTGLLVPRLTQGPGTAFPIRGCHPLRPAFPDGSGTKLQATGLFRFRSPLLAESLLMSFPPATEMFQFAGFASRTYGFSAGYSLLSGLPHSEIPGSTSARLYPGLFAACHVLHRLSVPRHPPNALTSTLDRKNPSLAETSSARNKPSREDTHPKKPEAGTQKAKPAPAFDIQTPSAFTEASVPPSAPR